MEKKTFGGKIWIWSKGGWQGQIKKTKTKKIILRNCTKISLKMAEEKSDILSLSYRFEGNEHFEKMKWMDALYAYQYVKF
jgi:hypothetical protein